MGKWKDAGRPLDDLSDWRLFVRVCEQGSLAAVGAAVGLDASTVSRRLSRLEERLKTRLLYRSSHRVQPTTEGLKFRDRMLRILDDYDHLLMDNAQSRDPNLEDTIVISASPCFHEFVVGQWAMRFQRQFPGIRFRLVLTEEALDPVARGIDIALHSGPFVRTIDSVPVFVLGQLTSAIMASPAYLREHGRPETPSDLQHHVLLQYTGKMSGRNYRLTGPDGKLRTYRFRTNMEATSTVGLIRSMLEGFGILLYASHFMLQDEIRSGRAVEILTDWKQPLTHVAAAVSPAGASRRAVLLFLQYMLDRWPDQPGFLRTTKPESLSSYISALRGTNGPVRTQGSFRTTTASL